ncbi:hypothetical protein RE476_12135 [Methanolobus mangrovi]|uniref:Uncharacterized protein n=1 Tax=Methanolobus mangrovi TaxID=3072977 RepID=A0AA51UFQ4_9EURY|nr:hypothetical protein [Methanolobus mangrovi]WMW22104.1 hypothetical protein RE476_12135 [Methanolobus mangrovi]
MVHSANGHVGAFAHLVQSLPDYSELLIAILILVLLLLSIDEIMDFIYVVKEIFTFKGMPFD